jgi:hypothetical protein
MCGRSASFFLIILGIMGTSMLITQVENNLHMTREQQTVMRMIAERCVRRLQMLLVLECGLDTTLACACSCLPFLLCVLQEKV